MTAWQHLASLSKRLLRSEMTPAVVMMVVGALFVAAGIHRFWVRPERFGLPALLGCVVGAFAGFFLLLITDYVLHHAPLVSIPWSIALVCGALVQPHLAVGLGVALWFMLASQLRA
jgi:hypothetical protein